jgi:hypothetical protein
MSFTVHFFVTHVRENARMANWEHLSLIFSPTDFNTLGSKLSPLMFTDNMINLFGLLKVPKTATLESLDWHEKWCLWMVGGTLIILKAAQKFFHMQYNCHIFQYCCLQHKTLEKCSKLSESVFHIYIAKFYEEFFTYTITFYISSYSCSQHHEAFTYNKAVLGVILLCLHCMH